jgi:hypothetical protein
MRALTVLLLFSALFAQEVRAEQRVALVLGNSDYKNVASFQCSAIRPVFSFDLNPSSFSRFVVSDSGRPAISSRSKPVAAARKARMSLTKALGAAGGTSNCFRGIA